MLCFPNAKHLLRLAALMMAFCLTGCSVGVNVDTMLTPPKLSTQQEQIYQALVDTTGSDIRLKYPKQGSYLSAFIIEDIDGDDLEEAIVFYEKNTLATTDLRINILDCIDNEWFSICDRSAEGSEIEKVVISPLGSNDRMNIIVGYSTSNQSEKYLSVYTYSEEYLNETFTHSYASFDVADSGSGNANPDLILLGAASSGSAYAAVYRLAEDGIYHEYRYDFRDNYTDYSQILYGTMPDGRVALYIDALTGTSNVQTEIVSMEDTQLVNLLERCGRKAEDTVRRVGLGCLDVDGDGVPEIPVQSVFLGYESAAESEQMRQTRWMMMENERIYTEHYSYYSTSRGYCFLFPEEWQNKVTVRYDTVSGETQFVAYSGEWTDDMPVLLRLYVAYDEADRNEHLDDGFRLMHSKGTASYLVRAEQDEELSVTFGSLLLCFRFLN